MNRNMLNLNTFDPAPMALGERTTRLPAEKGNPRAAFEAFERGDHTVKYNAVIAEDVKATGQQVIRDMVREMAKAVGSSFEKLARDMPKLTIQSWPTFSASAKPINAKVVSIDEMPPTNNQASERVDMTNLAVKFKEKFGIEAARRVMYDVSRTTRLMDVPDDKMAAVIARFQKELSPEPDDDDKIAAVIARFQKELSPEPDDGEGDTPDIAGRVKTARFKLGDHDTYNKIRRCFLEDIEAIDHYAKAGSPSMRFVQALERAVRDTEHPATLGMCHSLFLHQQHAGRDVARVMRSFNAADTRQLGDDVKLIKAFYACLVNVA